MAPREGGKGIAARCFSSCIGVVLRNPIHKEPPVKRWRTDRNAPATAYSTVIAALIMPIQHVYGYLPA